MVAANHHISVTLSPDQVRLARDYARLRNDRAKKAGRRDKHGATWSDDYRHHLTGTIAEVIYFSGMGIDEPVLTLDTYKDEPDVAPGLVAQFPLGAEVRGRNWSPTYEAELIIRQDDDPTMPYVLVQVMPDQKSGVIVGWIDAQEAMDGTGKFWSPNDRPAAWFVHPNDLRACVPNGEWQVAGGVML